MNGSWTAIAGPSAANSVPIESRPPLTDESPPVKPL